jgi:uncharacterized membrane protein YccF (DUF307 family)
MPLVSLLLNVFWLVFGGVWMAAAWLAAAAIMAITIIGLPWARSALTIALYTLLPFGHTVVDRDPRGMGPVGLIGNFVWFVLAGWWLALGHLVTAAGLALTVVGLPFAWAHAKLALLAIWPIGKEVVPAGRDRLPGYVGAR